MAYIDLTKITDAHAKRIIAKDSTLSDNALENAEVDTRMVARDNGVISTDIPVDGSGYITSEGLYVYCKWRYLFYLFSSVAGSYSTDDVYRVKLEQAEYQSKLADDKLSYYIITEEEVVDPVQRNTGFDIL